MVRERAAEFGFDALGDRLDGDVVVPGDEAYAEARRVWNGMFNEYPAGVSYCETVCRIRRAGRRLLPADVGPGRPRRPDGPGSLRPRRRVRLRTGVTVR
ncbi:hypothetical protein BRC64_02445 [Halobacteriales archaeon QH_10_67_22]|nr:MAG: hypothetical protein BRC64_02445 [Halobacteriales archaeon QH_10_67_22]